jgi:hypothetical protein
VTPAEGLEAKVIILERVQQWLKTRPAHVVVGLVDAELNDASYWLKRSEESGDGWLSDYLDKQELDRIFGGES